MVHVRVPATLANFGPAFDAFAVAITLYNEVTVEVSDRAQVEVRGEGEGHLPAGDTNLVHRAAAEVARRTEPSAAFSIQCHNRIPIGRGLGSSAAAIVGGAVAANELLGHPLSQDEVLTTAWHIEGHPDNVSAALLGGGILTCAVDGRLSWTRVTPTWAAALVVAVPEFAVPTAVARAALPERVPLKDAAANVSRTAWLVTSFLTGRTDLLPTAMEDFLHQPYRKPLVPGVDRVFAAARAGGAYAAALCGSGPSVVAVAPPEAASVVGQRMTEAFADAGSKATFLVVEIDLQGAKVTRDSCLATNDEERPE